MTGPTVRPELELLPCPSGHTKTTRDNNNIYRAWWVKCAEGECSWRTAGDTEAEAVAAWNRRTALAASGIEEMRGALEGAEREIIARVRCGLADTGMSAEQIAGLVDTVPAIVSIRAALSLADGMGGEG
jgi:hypothetical protein